MSLLFGILAIANLRILGVMRAVPFVTLQALHPWSVVAFGVNTLTGMLFVVAAADQYIGNVPFYWKVALLVPAGANLLYLTVADRVSGLDAGAQAPALDRAVAAGTIGIWVVIMYCGRMLAFLGTSF